MPIPPVMKEWFEKVREARKKSGILSPYICPSPRNSAKPRSKSSQVELLKSVATEIGLEKLTKHRLRASFATMLHRAGKNIKVIMKLMRHAKVETTLEYIEVDGEELQEAVSEVFG